MGAELYSFVYGVLGTEFLQLKTTDNMYLKDLLEKVVLPELAVYNAQVSELQRILCRTIDDSLANQKQMFSTNRFKEISDLEQPGMKQTFESWNRPVPIRRFGSSTLLTRENIVQMSSKAIEEHFGSIMVSDRQNVIKLLFESMCVKAPTERVDALTNIAATPKAFWNDETSMDTPRKNGQITFDGDHDHYNLVATADTLVIADIRNLIADITEHEGMSNGGQVILWARTGTTLNLIKGLTEYRAIEGYGSLVGAAASNPAFNQSGIVQALVKSKVQLANGVAVVGTVLDALVVETPDLPTYYILATMHQGPNSPFSPLAFRSHPQFQGLMLYNANGGNPIIGTDAQYRRYLGLGVWDRSAGAVLYTHHATVWSEPSFS